MAILNPYPDFLSMANIFVASSDCLDQILCSIKTLIRVPKKALFLDANSEVAKSVYPKGEELSQLTTPQYPLNNQLILCVDSILSLL